MINAFYIKVVIVTLAIIIGIASYYFGPFKGQVNNPVEKLAEEAIKEETNISIDLTPTNTPTEASKQNDTNAQS